MLVQPDFAITITLVCCVLHNMIRKKEEIINDVNSEKINVEEYDVSRERIRNAYQVQEKFVDYFVSLNGYCKSIWLVFRHSKYFFKKSDKTLYNIITIVLSCLY